MEPNVKCEKFLVSDLLAFLKDTPDDSKRVYTQLSDHYGISCTLTYQGNFKLFFNKKTHVI